MLSGNRTVLVSVASSLTDILFSYVSLCLCLIVLITAPNV